MKTNKYLNIAASVLMLAACAKEELVPSEELIPVSESTTVTFVATDGTKTSLGEDLQTTSWDKKENVLLWEEENALTIESKNYSDDGGKMTLTATVDSPESTFYSVIGPEGDGNATRTSAAVLATQKPAQASFDPNAEILVAQPATCGEDKTVALRYNRPVAITVATLKNLEEGEKVLFVKITANENLTGKVNFTYDGTNVKAEMEGTDKTITCNYTTNNTVVQGNEGEGYIFPVYFISLKAEVMVFEFEVCTDKHKYYRKITRPEGSPIILNDNRVAKFGFMLENADKADAEGDKFVKVTSTDELTDGDYLIVYETGNVALNGALTADQAENTVSVTISNNEITSTDAISEAVVTYDSSNGSLLGSGGKYVGHTGSKNTLDYSDSALENVITFDENGNAIITAGSYVMKFNNTSGQERFRYYTSGQKDIQLYKKEAGGYGKYTLATPKNIQYNAETQKITWDAVENAGKYTISLNGGESVECPSNEYDASTLAAEYYYATVVAYPSAEKEDTYKESEAGTNEGWLRIGEPKMLKLDADKITLNITSTSITASWENDVNATNGYIAEIWSRKTVETGETDDQGNPKTRLEDDELISKNENVTEGAITFTYLNAGTDYHIKVTTKATDIIDVRGTRAYANSDAANKYPKTSSVYTIAQIFDLESSTVACEVKKAVIYAKGESCYLVYDGTGYIMVNTSAGNYSVGDELTISGKTEKSNNQKRFDSTTTIVAKTGDATVEHPVVASYDNTFTYAKYVNIVGKMTSSSGWLVTDATDNKLKVFANDKTGANKYVSVTGYLTHTTASFAYLIATEIVEHTLTATPEELTWEATEIGAESVTIEAKDGETVAEWTYSPMSADGWQISTNDSGLQIAPTANTSIDKKELTIKVTHKTNTQLTKEIKLSQNGKEAVYEKVTSVNDLSVGDEIVITSSDGEQVMGEQRSNNVGAVKTTPVVPNYSTIKLPSSVLKLTLVEGTKSGQYAFTWKDGETTKYLYAASSSSNYLKSQSTNDDNGSWSITIDNNGTASIVAQGTNTRNILQYNSGSTIFACYGSASQSAVAIYKLQKTITSIEVSGTPTKTAYEVGEIFDPTGLTVTAYYEGSSSKTITSGITWTDGSGNQLAPLTLGTTSVTVKAVYENIPSNSFNVSGITVTQPTPKTNLAAPTNLSWTESAKTLTWMDTNTGNGTYDTNYKYQYSVDGGSSWSNATNSTTAELSITSTTTVKVKAVAITTDTYRDSDEASTECTITATKKTYSFIINTTNFGKTTSGSGYTPYNGEHTYTATATDGSGATMNVTIVSNQVMIQASKIQFQKNNGYIYNKEDFGKITSVTIDTSTGLTVNKGTSQNPQSNTASGDCGYFAIKAGSSTTPTCSTITITFVK